MTLTTSLPYVTDAAVSVTHQLTARSVMGIIAAIVSIITFLIAYRLDSRQKKK